MKRARIPLILMTVVIFWAMRVGPAPAQEAETTQLADQDASCDPATVVTSFAEAVSAGQVEAWMDDYLAGSCPDSVKLGVLALVRTYEALQVSASPADMGASEGELPEVTFAGENPVVEFTNILGLGARFEAGATSYIDDQRCLSIPGTVIEIAPRLFVSAPLVAVRQIIQEGPSHTILYSDGQEVAGTVAFTLQEVGGNAYDMSGVTALTVLSLPEAEAEGAAAAETEDAQVWQIELSDHDLVFTGQNPDFRYRWAGCNVTVIGGSPYGDSSSFNFLFNDQELRVNINDFAAIASSDGAITVTAPNGQQTSGTLSLGGKNGTTTSRWFLRLDIGGRRTLYVDSSANFTLSKVGN